MFRRSDDTLGASELVDHVPRPTALTADGLGEDQLKDEDKALIL